AIATSRAAGTRSPRELRCESGGAHVPATITSAPTHAKAKTPARIAVSEPAGTCGASQAEAASTAGGRRIEASQRPVTDRSVIPALLAAERDRLEPGEVHHLDEIGGDLERTFALEQGEASRDLLAHR